MEKETLQKALAYLGAKLDMLAGKKRLEVVANLDIAELKETNKLLAKLVERESREIEVTVELV